jgi:ABC-type transporter MlaC component
MARAMFRLMAVLAVLTLAGPGLADPAEDAGGLVRTIVADLTAARRAQAPEARVLSVLNTRFDLRALALAALSEPQRVQPAAQLDRYEAAYAAYLARVFVAQATGDVPGELQVLGTRQVGPAVILVATQISAPDRPRRQVDWYVRLSMPRRIVNAAVEGVLITTRQRRDFADVLDAQGMDGLVAALEAGTFDRLPDQ